VAEMTNREAIKVLMLSPFYFNIELATRKMLVKDFCLEKKQPQNSQTVTEAQP
jgi:hypothetical protein